MDDEPPSLPVVGGAIVSPHKRDTARQLRQTPTATEEFVWSLLRGRRMFGLKFRRQQVIRGYVVDFYCAELHLAIELDGRIHDGCFERDRWRQQALEQTGICFLRLQNDHVSRPVLAARIQDHLAATGPDR